MNYSNIMRSAIKLLLRFAPVYFGIERWPTRFDVSIVMPACWDYIDNPNGTPYLEPCYPYECCKTKYGVINYGRYLSDKERILIPQSNCSGVVQSDCFYYCDVNDLPIGSLLDQNSTTCSNDPCPEIPWDDTFYDSNCECNELFNPGGVNCCPPPQSGCTYYDCSVHGSFVGTTHIRVPMDINFPTKIAYFYTSFKICPATGRRVIRVEKVFLTPDLCYDASITNLDIFRSGLRLVLKNATMYFGDCNYGISNQNQYYIYMPACWERITQIMPGGGPCWLVPCNPQECCWYAYNLFNEYDTLPNRPGCDRRPMRRNAYCSGTYDDGITQIDCPPPNCGSSLCIVLQQVAYPGWLPRQIGLPDIGFPKRDNNLQGQLILSGNGIELQIKYYPMDNGSVQIKIVDFLGKEIFEVEEQNNNNMMHWTLNLRELTRGIYFIISLENGSITNFKKFVHHGL